MDGPRSSLIDPTQLSPFLAFVSFCTRPERQVAGFVSYVFFLLGHLIFTFCFAMFFFMFLVILWRGSRFDGVIYEIVPHDR